MPETVSDQPQQPSPFCKRQAESIFKSLVDQKAQTHEIAAIIWHLGEMNAERAKSA